MLSIEEIRKRMAPLNAELEAARDVLADAEGGVELVRTKIRSVQSRCSHPNKFETSCMGDTGWRCPDCGDSR
jgi:tRNA(Ile2) C34 agmatinyltransferase TiaS